MDKEIWRPIVGYENSYEVSNFGRVRSKDRIIFNHIKGKIFSPTKLKNGYYYVYLSNGKSRKGLRVHRLVAQAFIPNPENKPHVNHIDGDKGNNDVSNLEWNTCSENQQHAVKKKLIKSGCAASRSLLTAEQVRTIRMEYIPNSKEKNARVLAKKYNVSNTTILYAIARKTYKDVD